MRQSGAEKEEAGGITSKIRNGGGTTRTQRGKQLEEESPPTSNSTVYSGGIDEEQVLSVVDSTNRVGGNTRRKREEGLERLPPRPAENPTQLSPSIEEGKERDDNGGNAKNQSGRGRGSNNKRTNALSSSLIPASPSPTTYHPTTQIPTYFPTYAWPTYTPTVSEAPSTIAEARAAQIPTKRKKELRKWEKQEKQEEKGKNKGNNEYYNSTIVEEEEEKAVLETVDSWTWTPTRSPSKSVSAEPTVQTTEQPVVAPTEIPSVTNEPTATISIMGRQSKSSSQVPTFRGRYYGERLPSSSIHRPLSHGGLGTEYVPSPSPSSKKAKNKPSEGKSEPEATGPSRGSYGGGGRGPSRGSWWDTNEPTVAPTTSSVPSLSPVANETAVVASVSSNMTVISQELDDDKEALSSDNTTSTVLFSQFGESLPSSPALAPVAASEAIRFGATPMSSTTPPTPTPKPTKQLPQMPSRAKPPSRGQTGSRWRATPDPTAQQPTKSPNESTPEPSKAPAKANGLSRLRPSAPSRGKNKSYSRPSRGRYGTSAPTEMPTEVPTGAPIVVGSGRFGSPPVPETTPASRFGPPAESLVPPTKEPTKVPTKVPTKRPVEADGGRFGGDQRNVELPAKSTDPDKTTKVNLSFPVENEPKEKNGSSNIDIKFNGRDKQQPGKDETSKISLKWFNDQHKQQQAPTDPTMYPTSNMPTYFVFPSYTPTIGPTGTPAEKAQAPKPTKKPKKNKKEEKEDANGKDSMSSPPPTTNWPSYSPTTLGERRRPVRPGKGYGNNGRDHFKDPVPPPSSDRMGHGWTWKPTPGDDDNVGSSRLDEKGKKDKDEQAKNEKSDELASDEDGSEANEQEDEADDSLEDTLINALYEKQTCPGQPFGIDPMSPKREQQVFFAYGIQTTTGKHGREIEQQVERIQLWILEDVARHLLKCNESHDDEDGVSGFTSGTGDSRLLKMPLLFEQPVSRVYYMEDESIATLSSCTPTVKNATDCAIVQSAIYITANIGHEYGARIKALSILNHHLERGSYEQGTILHTSYLGPDLSKFKDAFGDKNGEGNVENSSLNVGVSSDSSSSPPISFYFATGVLSLAVCASVLYLLMMLRVRRERRRVALASISNTAVPSSSHRLNSDVVTVDDLLYSPPSRASARKSIPLESMR